MANSSVIKEFLVSLGYKIDVNQQKRFTESVDGSTKVVDRLGTALKVLTTGAVAVGAIAWFDKMASSMEGLYYASRRSNASAANLQAFGYAASQMGSNVQAAQGAVQSLNQWIRNNPGAESLLQRNIGVATRNANGELRDTTDLIQDIGKRLSAMPTYRANQYAGMLGIDLPTLMALKEGMGGFMDDYRKMAAEAHLDLDKAATNSHLFEVKVRSLGGAFSILQAKIEEALLGNQGGGGALDKFRDILLSHSTQITRVIERLADFAGRMFVSILDWLDRVDWDAVGEKIGKAIQWVEEIDWDNIGKKVAEFIKAIGEIVDIFGGWKNVAIALGAVLGIQLIGNITSMLGLFGRFIPALGGVAAGFQAIGAAAAVAGAGVAGYAAGTYIYNHAIAGTKAGDKIGEWITKSLAFVGVESAQETLDNPNHRYSAYQMGLRPGRAQQAAAVATGTGSTRGIRNNNPGNLRYNDYTRGLGATGADASGFAIFPDAATGINAIGANLASYGRKGFNTPSSIAHRWSTTDQDAYTQRLASMFGGNPNQSLDMTDPRVINALRNAIILQENGSNPYAPEMRGAATAAAAGVGSGPQLKADTTININGAKDPAATGRAVAAEQDGVNQRLTRNFGGITS